MEIEYLKHLNNHPSASGLGGLRTLKPISMDEIICLESIYNGGNPFPKALRELLYT
ncbi:hypothetical protein LX99_04102 [Mucilaginibacter oryzae]|uniref:Uncharacterized protein n=1 Tax=Mucilaginibacter oryzae TaxID=468058 RepID=A0A316H1J4_9SPHI|nr:hypothetical protein LX99_04102 [Mucilaginibacter oryzae]